MQDITSDFFTESGAEYQELDPYLDALIWVISFSKHGQLIGKL